jgi:hypothetical protein
LESGYRQFMHWVGSGIGVVAVVLGMLGITVTASASGGLEPGVHVDPGSPAAKEYALPLNQARRTGAAPGSSETAAGALFGAGIKPPGGGTGGPSRTHSAHGGASSQAAPGDASSSSPQLSAAVLRAANGAGGGGGDGSLLALIGGGVAILILGGFGGTVLRHSRRPSA